MYERSATKEEVTQMNIFLKYREMYQSNTDIPF